MKSCFRNLIINLNSFHFNIAKPENSFFLIALLFGLIMCFLNPPFLVPDENAHFDRAFSLSRGILQSSQYETLKTFDDSYTTHWYPIGMGINTENINYILSKFSETLDINKISIDKSSAGYTIFFVYLPQAVGIWISTIIHLSPIALFYTGRVFALLFWIFLITISIKLIPVMKWPLVILALSPMSIQQASSYSADSVINGLSFLFISYVIFLSFSHINHYSSGKLLLLSILSILVVLSKPTNVILLLSIMLLSTNGFISKNKRNTFVYSLICICSLVWLVFLLFFSTNNILYFNSNFSIKRQLLYIFINPIIYIQTFIHTISTNFIFYFKSWIGIMAFINIRLPEFLYIIYFFLLLYAIYSETNANITISKEQRIGILIISLLYFIAIFTTLYLTYTSVADPTIDGVQGRYFIPITPLLLIPFIRPKNNKPYLYIRPIINRGILIFFSIFILGISIYSLVIAVYDPCGTQFYNITKKCTLPLSRVITTDQLSGEIINTNISQSIVSKCNSLTSFDILFSTYSRINTSSVIISISDAHSNYLVSRATLNSNSFKDNNWVNISFPSISNSKDRQYNISIQSNDSKPGNAVAVWETNIDIYPESNVYINGINTNKDLVVIYSCNYGLLLDLSKLLSSIRHIANH